jgi:hypothetical protein
MKTRFARSLDVAHAPNFVRSFQYLYITYMSHRVTRRHTRDVFVFTV